MTTPKHTADELLSTVEEIIDKFSLPGMAIYTISHNLQCPEHHGIDVHEVAVDTDGPDFIYDFVHDEGDDIPSARRTDRATALILLDTFLTILAHPQD
jgi:hypothetical protein